MPSLSQIYAQPPQPKYAYWTHTIAKKFSNETGVEVIEINRQRLLTCMLHSDALWIPESADAFDNYNRYFSWRSGQDPITEELLRYNYFRFNVIDPEIRDDVFQRRVDYGWDSAKHIIASDDPTTDIIKHMVKTWDLRESFLDYVLRDPNPDFIRCNRKFGWLGAMTNADVLLDRGRAMLREQMVTVYGFSPDNLTGSANPGGQP